MPGNINRWAMVTGGMEGSHQHTRAEGSTFSHIDFYKIQNSSQDTCPHGQQSSSQQGHSWPLQTNMGLSAVEKDHKYCRVPARSSECDSKLGVPQFSGHKQLETFPGNICKNLSEISYSQYRPFCIPHVSSTPSLHDMEARSGKSGNQCHVSTIGKNVPIWLSPIQPNALGIVEAKERKDHNGIGGTNYTGGNHKHDIQFF